MKYKLIASDFDGTLCRSDNTVSARSRKVIDEYFRRGGIFTLSSGRNLPSIRAQLKQAGLMERDIPLLSLQGSVIEDNLTGKLLYKTTLPKEQVEWLSYECTKRGLYYQVYTPYNIFSSVRNEYSDFYTGITGVDMEFVGDLHKFIVNSSDDFVKLFIIAPREKNAAIASELKSLAPEGMDIYTTGPFYFECINSAAGKGNGLKAVAGLLGVDMSETMAFGDEMNDKSALEAAGLGVAVANAREELKAVADLITSSNDLDGVAEVIEKYCLSTEGV